MKLAFLIPFTLFAQQTVTIPTQTLPVTLDPRSLVQKFFGSGDPGTVAGNAPGDLFFDRAGHRVFWCDAIVQGGTFTNAACSAVGVGNWTLMSAAIAPSPTPSPQWSMGFWTAWAADPNARKISDIEWGAMSHIIQVGVEPNPNGSLAFSDVAFAANATALVQAAHANGVKILLNVWAGPGDFNGAISSNLSGFVNNLMALVDQYGFDGIDVDWESNLNQARLSSLLSALRARLGTRLLTADATTNDSAIWGTVHQFLDRVNVMTYDEAGTWNPYSWVNSALVGDPCDCVWSMDLAKRRYLAVGVPIAKLGMGLPFYGWTSSGGGISGPRTQWQSTKPNMGQITYTSLMSQFPAAANPLWDSGTHTPFLRTPTGWITFDNAASITEKIQYVKSQGLAGWIIWAIDQDYIAGAAVKHPLMQAVKAAR